MSDDSIKLFKKSFDLLVRSDALFIRRKTQEVLVDSARKYFYEGLIIKAKEIKSQLDLESFNDSKYVS